jgi:hypothetical protein
LFSGGGDGLVVGTSAFGAVWAKKGEVSLPGLVSDPALATGAGETGALAVLSGASAFAVSAGGFGELGPDAGPDARPVRVVVGDSVGVAREVAKGDLDGAIEAGEVEAGSLAGSDDKKGLLSLPGSDGAVVVGASAFVGVSALAGALSVLLMGSVGFVVATGTAAGTGAAAGAGAAALTGAASGLGAPNLEARPFALFSVLGPPRRPDTLCDTGRL